MKPVLAKLFLLATVPLVVIAISGCGGDPLAELNVEPGNNVATYDVIDSM